MKAPAADADLMILEARLEAARRDVHNLMVARLRPNLSSLARDLLPHYERSARAEVRRRREAVERARRS